MGRYAEKLHIVPVFVPQASTATAGYEAQSVALKNADWVTFLVNWGDMTSDSTDTLTFRVESSTAAGSTTSAIAQTFTYRLASAITGDDWGDATSATSVAVTAAANDSMALVIDVDPAAVTAADTDAKYLNLAIDAEIESGYVSAWALIEDRYPQSEHLSST